MELQRFNEPIAFRAHVGAFLETHEAENCVQIGMLTTRSLIPSADPIYCATVVDGAAIQAVAIMTPPYHLLITPAAPSAAVDLIAHDLAGEAVMVTGVMADPATSLRFAQTWQDVRGGGFAPTMSERLYRLARVIPITGVAGRMRAISEADRPLLVQWLADFEQEALGTALDHAQIHHRIDRYLTLAAFGLYLWEVDGEVVALAAHSGPTPHGMRIGPVYTPPGLRGHGYARALVADLSQMLLAGGRQFCFLFTDLTNPTSNHIYQAIGYTPVSDVQVYRFT
ncbi:MAG: GNAT family N-acetyltransferase [Ktedonobacterales bacterium]|nr:GNAT family N-acetyltransferase [Ktedonobacterales bacterium]